MSYFISLMLSWALVSWEAWATQAALYWQWEPPSEKDPWHPEQSVADHPATWI